MLLRTTDQTPKPGHEEQYSIATGEGMENFQLETEYSIMVVFCHVHAGLEIIPVHGALPIGCHQFANMSGHIKIIQ